MADLAERARKLIDSDGALNPKWYEIVELPCDRPGCSYFGANLLDEYAQLTIGTMPVVVVDDEGAWYLDHDKWRAVWREARLAGLLD